MRGQWCRTRSNRDCSHICTLGCTLGAQTRLKSASGRLLVWHYYSLFPSLVLAGWLALGQSMWIVWRVVGVHFRWLWADRLLAPNSLGKAELGPRYRGLGVLLEGTLGFGNHRWSLKSVTLHSFFLTYLSVTDGTWLTRHSHLAVSNVTSVSVLLFPVFFFF